MYLPAHFAQVDAAQVAATIAAHPLACIVAQTGQGLVANHIPLVLSGSGVLVGHVALANDMHRAVPDGAEVLAIFRGVEGYVSPNHYPTKAEHHRHVPTWNYEVVHVQGEIRFQHDDRSKRAAVGLLTSRQERPLHGDAAWRMADAPVDYMAQMLAGIVAFRITVRQMVAKAKLSQNRAPVDRDGVVAGLRAAGADALADRVAQAAPGPDRR